MNDKLKFEVCSAFAGILVLLLGWCWNTKETYKDELYKYKFNEIVEKEVDKKMLKRELRFYWCGKLIGSENWEKCE